jgi:subtilase family serine protease
MEMKIFQTTCLAFLLILSASYAFSQPPSDIYYQVNPFYVQVSPDTVIPQSIPFCRTSIGLLICYSPQFLKKAYNFPSNLDGAGQTIIIVDAYGSPTITEDLKLFDRLFDIPDPPSFTILCDPQGCPSFNPRNIPHDELGWTIETTLDVEYAHAMASGANIVLSVASSNSGNAINVAESRAISLYPNSIISQSFGIPEYLIRANNAQVIQAEKNYETAASRGITVLASAGDSGAGNGINIPNADFPASSPFVTSVGGTMGNPYLPSLPCTGSLCSAGLVTYDNSTGACHLSSRLFAGGCSPTGYGGEQAWNEKFLPAATGGAPSLIFPSPSYQQGVTGFSMRTTPDVAYNAAVNGGVLVVYSALTPSHAVIFIVGGTSAGSPQWAAIFALVNQARMQNGFGPIGFANPKLYSIYNSQNYNKDFHDVTLGNNTFAGTSAGFFAGPGYDLTTGLGTPNVANLVSDLASSP